MPPTEMQELKKQVTDLKSQQASTDAKIDRVLSLLEGDRTQPHLGLISRILAIEKFIENFQKKKSYILGNVSATVFIVTMLGSILLFSLKTWQYFKEFFHK